MSLAGIAIRRPVFTTVVFLVVSLIGAVAFFLLPVDLMPDMTFPTITVRTAYAGVGPQEIEELITIPLERALASTPGVEEITSTSSEGNSQVRVTFEWGTDLDAATDEVRSRIDRVRGVLPDDADTPYVYKFDVTTFPIMFFALSGQMNPRDLREFAENQIQYRLERVAGVAQADVYGGLRREIQVSLDRNKMNALRIDPGQVSSALRRENLNEPVGQVIEGKFEVLLRTQGEYANLEQIANTMVTRREGRPVFIHDLGTVSDNHEEIRSLVRVNGKPGLRMSIRKMSGANTVEVAKSVHGEVEKINRDFPQIKLSSIYDSGVFIANSINNVRDAALYGSLLAVLVLLIFLRNLRSTLVIAITIPITVIATFALMYFYGFTLNTVSFGGLALGVGMLVDNSIVILENIFRHREAGEPRKDAARKGTEEVALALTASTLTTVVVFLPIVFMSGMSGVMFKQLAWIVCFTQFTSLLAALTLLPLMASRMIRVEEPNPRSWSYAIIHKSGALLDAVDERYARGISWALRHRGTVMLSTVAVLVGTCFLIPFIGYELQPETDEGELRVSLELPPGSRLEFTDEVAKRAEEIVRREVPEARYLLTEVGSTGGGFGFGGSNTNTASLRLTLVPKSERKRNSQQIALALRPEFARFPGVITRVRSGGSNFLSRMGNTDGDRLSVDIRSYDMVQSFDLAVRIKRMMEDTEGISDAVIGRSPGRPETRVLVDRDKASAMGLSVSEIAANLRTSIGGTTAAFFRQRGEEYNIRVRYSEEDRKRLEDVLAVPIQTPSGLVVPLQSLVTLERSEGPVGIQRKDQQRIITVNGNLSGTRDMGSIVGELQEQFRTLNLPADTAVVFGGEWEDQQKAFFALQLSLLMAIVLVYLVMAAEFESFKYPFLIMFSMPLGAIGVVLALFLTNTTFNMQAFIGVIMLAGIVVNNAIVLVDYILQLQREHDFSLVDALVTGGRRRLRPILMTTLTSVLGLLPMALGIGEGAELQAPMARVLIGGLLTSTLITLFFIPSLYLTMERLRFGRRKEIAVEPSMRPASRAMEVAAD